MSIQVSTIGFSGMCRELARVSKRPYRDAVKQETALTLSAAVKRTKAVKVKDAQKKVSDKIDAKFNTFTPGRAGTKDTHLAGEDFQGARGHWPVISRSSRNGRVWYGGPDNWRLMKGGGEAHRYPRALWAEFLRAESARRSEKDKADKAVRAGVRRAHGLAKRAFYDAAKSIGVDRLMKNVPAYVKKAIPSNRRRYVNARGRDESGVFKTLLTVTITQPVLASKNMGVNALSGAFGDRRKAFETDLKKGVFRDVRTRATRYPGLFLK